MAFEGEAKAERKRIGLTCSRFPVFIASRDSTPAVGGPGACAVSAQVYRSCVFLCFLRRRSALSKGGQSLYFFICGRCRAGNECVGESVKQMEAQESTKAVSQNPNFGSLGEQACLRLALFYIGMFAESPFLSFRPCGFATPANKKPTTCTPNSLSQTVWGYRLSAFYWRAW